MKPKNLKNNRHESFQSLGIYFLPSPDASLVWGYTDRSFGDFKERKTLLKLENSLSDTFKTKIQVAFASQVHQTHIEPITYPFSKEEPPFADGLLSKEKSLALVIRVADCLPLVLYSKDESILSVLHAGWRSFLGGILEQSFSQFQPTHAALGPSICGDCYEVGEEVVSPLLEKEKSMAPAVSKKDNGRFHLDLAKAATILLEKKGVSPLSLPPCSAFHASKFFSHRARGESSRMAMFAFLLPSF